MLIPHLMHRPAVSSLFKSAFEGRYSLGTIRTTLHVVSHNLSLFRGERGGVLYFSLWPSPRLAWVTTRPSSCQEEVLESRACWTWITAMNQSGRHCARTSELRQLAPATQLPWFPACSSQPVWVNKWNRIALCYLAWLKEHEVLGKIRSVGIW